MAEAVGKVTFRCRDVSKKSKDLIFRGGADFVRGCAEKIEKSSRSLSPSPTHHPSSSDSDSLLRDLKFPNLF